MVGPSLPARPPKENVHEKEGGLAATQGPKHLVGRYRGGEAWMDG